VSLRAVVQTTQHDGCVEQKEEDDDDDDDDDDETCTSACSGSRTVFICGTFCRSGLPGVTFKTCRELADMIDALPRMMKGRKAEKSCPSA